MGACSSRPRVLEDAPQPEVDNRTREEITTVEAVAAAASDNHAVSENAEVFQDTLNHNPEVRAEEENTPMVVEKNIVEVEATPAATEVPFETEELQKVPEIIADVKYSNQEETTSIDDVPDNDEPKPVGPVETDTNKVVAEDSAVLESEGRKNTPAEDVQEVITPSDPIIADSSAHVAAEPESEGKTGVSESVAQPSSGNPFQAFVSNVTKGWGWH